MRIYTEEPHGHSHTFTLSCKFATNLADQTANSLHLGHTASQACRAFLRLQSTHQPTPRFRFVYINHTQKHMHGRRQRWPRPTPPLARLVDFRPQSRRELFNYLATAHTHTQVHNRVPAELSTRPTRYTHKFAASGNNHRYNCVCVCAHASQTVHIYMLWT